MFSCQTSSIYDIEYVRILKLQNINTPVLINVTTSVYTVATRYFALDIPLVISQQKQPI